MSEQDRREPTAPARTHRELRSPIDQGRPRSVRNSVVLWLSVAAIGVASVIAKFIMLDDLVAAVLTQSNLVGQDEEAIRDSVRDNNLLGLVRVAILTSLALWMRRGYKGGRFILTAVAVVAMALLVETIAMEFPLDGVGAFFGTVSVIQVALMVPAVVLMYVPESNRFFRPTPSSRPSSR